MPLTSTEEISTFLVSDLVCPTPEVEDVAVEFVVPGGLLALEEDHITEVPVLVLLHQTATRVPAPGQEPRQTGQWELRLHLPEMFPEIICL